MSTVDLGNQGLGTIKSPSYSQSPITLTIALHSPCAGGGKARRNRYCLLLIAYWMWVTARGEKAAKICGNTYPMQYHLWTIYVCCNELGSSDVSGCIGMDIAWSANNRNSISLNGLCQDYCL